MKLQTQLTVPQENNQIDYSSEVLLVGSCFVENIGEKLEYYKFQNLQNPFGIIFHPLAVERLVFRAINDSEFKEEDIFFHNEQWHCFEVHSVLSTSDKAVFLNSLNTSLVQLKKYLLSASHIVFTYGTAWVYRNIESNELVANCHKIPQQQFKKELLSVDAVTKSIGNTIEAIKSINPATTFILTVSPVRHLKDGFVQNSQSKAHLIAGSHQVLGSGECVHYFPSYEIVMDELRDYRFYSEDMLHPNKTAIAIIWERFKEAWIASETNEFQKEIGAIQAGLQHRPFNPESEAHQGFMASLQQKIQTLQNKFPYLKF